MARMKRAFPARKIPLFLLSLSLLSLPAVAHSPIFACAQDGDERISCEGGFSNGSSAEGIAVRVLDAEGAVLEEGRLDAAGRITLKRPAVQFSVLFFPDENHSLTLRDEDISSP